jgi:uncharacterized membrane protein YraQ (UPF0718 family)
MKRSQVIELIIRNKLLSSLLVIEVGLLMIQPELGRRVLNNSTYYLIEMFQILPVVFMLTVGIHVLVPKEWITKRLGHKSGVMGLLLALLFGSVSAGPIYAAFPICKTLLKKGASVANITVIISAWAVVKFPMLANEVKFIGADFMVTRWVLTIFGILAMAFLMNRTVPISSIPLHQEAKEKLQLNKTACIQCGLCIDLAPDVFRRKGDGIEIIQVNGSRNNEGIIQAEKKCPVGAIRYQE